MIFYCDPTLGWFQSVHNVGPKRTILLLCLHSLLAVVREHQETDILRERLASHMWVLELLGHLPVELAGGCVIPHGCCFETCI